MCNEFCKEFTGWCRSFTRKEVGLSALEALLLALLIGFIVFLTLHLLVCSEKKAKVDQVIHPPAENKPGWPNAPILIPVPTTKGFNSAPSGSTTTLSPDIECTWEPSKKTPATARYYWTPRTDRIKYVPQSEGLAYGEVFDGVEYEDDIDENPDGVDAPRRYKDFVAALVKLKLPADVTYGCILTKVTRYWTLTAASCIESIEEVDTLDSFFISETFGEVKQGMSHELADVRIHPLYQGMNRTYDLAALRSADALAPDPARLPRLPTVLEYFMVGLGEKFIILGHGGYRSIDNSATGRRLRQVATYAVSLAQCGGAGGEGVDTWAPRHLVGGGALARGACASCGAAALCAGARAARAAPCAYCGGTPLLRRALLFGVMSDNPHCGVACEPALYVNVAALRDWIESVVYY